MTITYLLAGHQNQLVPDPVSIVEAETIGIMSDTTPKKEKNWLE
jgi:hypothetical protein